MKLSVPEVKRIVYLRNSGQSSAASDAATAAAARAHGLVFSVLVIDSAADFDVGFTELMRRRPDAIWAADSAANIAHRARITLFAARERLPAVYGNPQLAVGG